MLPEITTGRKAVAEGLGTALLWAAIVGSGIMGERLAGGTVAFTPESIEGPRNGPRFAGGYQEVGLRLLRKKQPGIPPKLGEHAVSPPSRPCGAHRRDIRLRNASLRSASGGEWT